MGKKNQTRVLNEKDVRSLLKDEKSGGLYFIFGNESFLKNFYANEIAKKAVSKDFEDFNLHRLDGKNTSVEMLKEAVEALPMLSEYTCVLVDDFPIFGMDQQSADNLLAVLSDVPPSCYLIFLMSTIERKTKKLKKDTEKTENEVSEGNKNEKTDSKPDEALSTDTVKPTIWDDILAIAQSDGFAIEINKRSFNELTALLIKGASVRGKTIEQRTARYLLESVGDDIANLQNELDKICAFVKHDKITEKDIDLIAVKTVEARIYDMAKHLTTKNSDEAFSVLDTLISQSVEPTLIMGTLIAPFVDMYRVKSAMLAGRRPDDVANYYNYSNKLFRLTNQTRLIRNLSINQLDVCLNILNDADIAIKGRSIEPRLIIEQTMTRIAKAILVQ